MEESHCVLLAVSTLIKEELIPEESNRSDEKTVPKEDFIPGESQCNQPIGKVL